MENEYSPWAMFHSTDLGDNLEEMVETEDCKVLRMNDPSGDGLMTIYRVFDGVYLMANMIGDLLGGCRDTNIYLQHCLVMALLWVGRCGFHSISTTLSHKATFAVLGNICKRVCEKLTRVPLGTVLDMPSGSVKNVLVERIDSIETTMAHITPEFTSNLLVPIALLVYLFVLDWRMALAVLVTVPSDSGAMQE